MTTPNSEAGGHLNDLELAAYIDRGLTPGERNRIESHLGDCADCRAAATEASLLLARARTSRWRIGASAAAAAAVLLLISAPVARRVAERNSAYRGEQNHVSLVAHGPAGEVSRNALRFVWAPAPRAVSYRITVTTSGGATIWSQSRADTVAPLPDSVRLVPGAHYFWVADALLSDGTSRSTELREFVPIK